jgi:hypothetical protein
MSIEDITHQHDMTGNERRRLSVPLLFRPTVRCGSPPESALYLNTLTVSFLRMDAATGSLRDARRDGRRSSCVREMSRRAGCTCVNSIRDARTAPPGRTCNPAERPPQSPWDTPRAAGEHRSGSSGKTDSEVFGHGALGGRSHLLRFQWLARRGGLYQPNADIRF